MLKSLLNLLGFKRKETKPVVKVYKPLPKGKVIAKILSAYDVESMYDDKRQDPGLCPVCHTALQKIPNLEYRMQKKKGDIFYTDDSFCIVTEKFKKFCETNKYEKLTFIALPKSPGYYYFEPGCIFKADPIRSLFDFGTRQSCCGQHKWIVIGTLLCKDKNFYLSTDDFISQLDYWVGNYYRKSPLIIIGLKTAGKMRQAGITGMCFENVIE